MNKRTTEQSNEFPSMKIFLIGLWNPLHRGLPVLSLINTVQILPKESHGTIEIFLRDWNYLTANIRITRENYTETWIIIP